LAIGMAPGRNHRSVVPGSVAISVQYSPKHFIASTKP
jgi:hypothetical protein